MKSNFTIQYNTIQIPSSQVSSCAPNSAYFCVRRSAPKSGRTTCNSGPCFVLSTSCSMARTSLVFISVLWNMNVVSFALSTYPNPNPTERMYFQRAHALQTNTTKVRDAHAVSMQRRLATLKDEFESPAGRRDMRRFEETHDTSADTLSPWCCSAACNRCSMTPYCSPACTAAGQ